MADFRIENLSRVAVGSPITGGTADCVLYLDSSGNLATNTGLKYYDYSGFGTLGLVVENALVLPYASATGVTYIASGGPNAGLLSTSGGMTFNAATSSLYIGGNLVSEGNISAGIYPSSATARFHVQGSAAGSASTAGLKLNSGTLLISTEAGALENNGTHLYFTFSDGGTRYQLDQQITTPLTLALGGTSKALTASNGGIVYTDSDSMEILSGTATAGQILRSGSSSAPSWSTATYPSTTTANRILYSSATNTIADLATANNALLVTNGSGVPSVSSTIPLGVTFTAATTADQSFNVPAGTAPTSPVEGDYWNDSTQKSHVAFVDGIKQYDWRTIFVSTANGATANGSVGTEQDITPTGVGTLTLPANFFLAGKILRITLSIAQGQLGTNTPIITFKVKKGSSILATFAVTMANNSGTTIFGELPIVGLTTTTTKCRSKMFYGSSVSNSDVKVSTDETISTSSESITVTATWTATSHSSDTYTVEYMLVEVGL